jgi:aryl-alcohol dehydrogenase-like predicted oxidoreductase
MKQLKPIIDFIYSISIDYNISVLQICLGYALQKQKIDHVVVGIDNIDQLKEIIQVNQYLSPDLIHQIEKIQLEDNTLLNPSTW